MLLKKLLRKYIAGITFFVYSYPQRIKSFYRNRISRLSHKINVIGEEVLNETRIAIIAIYPRKETLKSTLRLLNALSKLKVFSVVVINQSKYSELFIDEIQNSFENVLIITRPNIGRDFGAYQAGFKYLVSSSKIEKLEEIFFINDSVLWGDKSYNILSDLSKQEDPWACLLVNYDMQLHAQSFLIKFKKEVFMQKSFIDFWHKYKPTELRYLTINKGEILLSKILIKMGFNPIPIINPKSITKHSKFGKLTRDEIFALMLNGSYDSQIDINKINDIKFMIAKKFMESNVSHYLGLLLSRLLGAPLKLDLFRTGMVTQLGVEKALESLGLAKDEKEEVLRLMFKDGTYASVTGIKLLWRNYGYC